MKLISKINVFTFGDSRLLSTWSNVPYFLTTILEQKGIAVNRINIGRNHFVKYIWEKVASRILSRLFKDNIYWYDRTLICYIETFIRIWFLNKRHADADLNLFTGYNFYNPFSDKPNVLFSDWDYETMIKEKRERNPYFFEKWSINRQEKVIHKADLVISLFPNAAEEMRIRYQKKSIISLGKNVINNLYKGKIDENDILKEKQKSNKILFIGTLQYIKGAEVLIEAFKILKKENPKLELTIIGLAQKKFSSVPIDGITFYSYLDKGIEQENQTYYDELISAKVIVNPTPLWAGYSSIVEAMYFYSPVVVSPYSDFVDEFGKDIGFGEYCMEFTAENLAESIQNVLQNNDYKQMCLNARNCVKDYTWESYVERLIDELKKIV